MHRSGDNRATLPAWQKALLVVGVVVLIVVRGPVPAAAILSLHRRRQDCARCSRPRRSSSWSGSLCSCKSSGSRPALGTFLAGVVLAESEYRVELEADIEPFKGLLLGLFFISVGASIDFSLIARQPSAIALIVAGLLVIKFGVLLLLSRLFRLKAGEGFLFAFALAQGGEFAFVLFAFAAQNAVLSVEVASLLVASVALSMAVAPLLFTIHYKLVRPWFQNMRAAARRR